MGIFDKIKKSDVNLEELSSDKYEKQYPEPIPFKQIENVKR
jgi:hypothetical protein